LGKHHQRIILGVVLAFNLEILIRDNRDNQCRGDEDPIEEDGEAIHHQRAVESLAHAVG
jgi:hypothetical protein